MARPKVASSGSEDSAAWGKRMAIKREYLPQRYVVELRLVFSDPEAEPDPVDLCQLVADAIRDTGYDLEYAEFRGDDVRPVRPSDRPRSE